jgi:hypothetical protein
MRDLRRLFALFTLGLLLASCVSQNAGTSSTPPTNLETAPSPTATAELAATSTRPQPTLTPTAAPLEFDGERALRYLKEQMAFGPRWPGSEGHTAVRAYIRERLQASGWSVATQDFSYQGLDGQNVIARANEGKGGVVILGAHYDTRRIADQTPGAAENLEPVPGAVDGASGVAVLLELANTIDLQRVPFEIWLAFFDMEDQGYNGMEGWSWIVGSSYMAEHLEITPVAMVLVDMVGDADQQLYYEGNSDEMLRAELWDVAAGLGYGDVFIPTVKYTMIDDHYPFVQQGIPAVDIIDFDYPYWHTVEDTADKASAQSLMRVGRTVEVWLETDRK